MRRSEFIAGISTAASPFAVPKLPTTSTACPHTRLVYLSKRTRSTAARAGVGVEPY
jgi:hypothetical protein